jgi:uncharacterized protein YeaO (DUF488 family)
MRNPKVKRVYEEPEPDDGLRILMDRLWPRGLKKEAAKIDRRMKEIAPSDELRSWFAHKAERWEEFKKRYYQELEGKKDIIEELKILTHRQPIALLYAAKDNTRNNAVVIQRLLKA